MRPLLIMTGVAIATFAIGASQSPASAQTPTSLASVVATPLRIGGLPADHTRLDAGHSWRFDVPERQRGAFSSDHRHWSWLFPTTAVPPFASDPLQRRHWWLDPLLRRHRWQ